MPLLDIATAQTFLQNHLGPLRAQSLLHCKGFSTSFTCGDDKRLLSIWRSFQLPKAERVNIYQSSKLLVKAVATLEPKCLVHKLEGQKGYNNANLDLNSDTSSIQVPSSSSDSTELDEKETLRRMRISKANKGNTPWNKGRKHSEETLRRIRERTKLAMQDPKVRRKLAGLGHAQSKETRVKIGVGVRMGWKRRREKQMVQETCCFEWQNLIAEAARRGYVGEGALQWNSYEILREKLEVEWVESVELRKASPRPKGSKRAPKSPEQRRKIAEAIAAKWADPEYRERVCIGLAKYHGTPVEGERKPKRKPSCSTQSAKPKSTRKKTSDASNSSECDAASAIQRLSMRRSKTPPYKDPLASSKLEMIKTIRAQRAATETKQTEAVERARLLIAEAEKAANALEVAAMKSHIARDSLIETRKLICEAIQSLESIGTGYMTSNWNDNRPSFCLMEQASQFERETDIGNGGCNMEEAREVNGTKILASSMVDNLNFCNLSFPDILNGENGLIPTSSNGFGVSVINFGSLTEQSSSANPLGQLESSGSVQGLANGCKIQHVKGEVPKSVTTTKKWVRGRLVDVEVEVGE